MSPPVLGCCRLQPRSPFIIITQPKSWYLFTVPWRVEGWVDLGTAGKVHTARAETSLMMAVLWCCYVQLDVGLPRRQLAPASHLMLHQCYTSLLAKSWWVVLNFILIKLYLFLPSVLWALSERKGIQTMKFNTSNAFGVGTGIRGMMRGMANLPQGNQELFMVKDKVGRPPGEFGVNKSMACDIFLQCFDTVVFFATGRASGL